MTRPGLTAVSVLFAICSSGVAQPVAPLRIGTITIDSSSIYSADETAHGSLYRVADKLHIETRPSVVRGFLLFQEGDLYDPARLAETERNLRSLGFLRSATVTASAPHDGYVDVLVRTQDTWSIDPTSEAGSKGGFRTFGVGFADSNLAGFGRQVSISYAKGTERTRAAIDYRDPSFFRPYWQSRFTWARNSDGFERRVAIGRPFYSFTTPWSMQVAFDEVRQTDHLYNAGRLADAFEQHHRNYVAAIGYALHPNEVRALRITAGVRAVSDDFFNTRSAAAALPMNRSFNYLFARFERVDNDFLKMNYIDKDLRYQDFNIGQQLSMEVAVSPRAQGAPTSEYVRLSETIGRQIGDDTFVLPSVSFESRFDHGVQNAILSANARYIHRFDTALPQTFVARLLLNSGRKLDREVQFFADGGSGLRGYRLHSFAGDRNLVVNLEQRLFLGRELLQIMSPGVVAFADVGTATNRSFLTGSQWKSDIGVGIRLGLPRAPRNLLRIDFAYPLNANLSGKRHVLVSFSSGQAF